MYIESADLSEKHAEIKFIDNFKYILRDCGSKSGTWTKTTEIDLYQQIRKRIFKVCDYQFMFIYGNHSIDNHNLGQDYFDEVGCWLRKHGFYKYYELFK